MIFLEARSITCINCRLYDIKQVCLTEVDGKKVMQVIVCYTYTYYWFILYTTHLFDT